MKKNLCDDAIYRLIENMCVRAKKAAKMLRNINATRKKEALHIAADEISRTYSDILLANGKDMMFARQKGLKAAMLDRLELTDARIGLIVDGLRVIAQQPDPIDKVIDAWERPTGLKIKRVRTPLGVIGVIYESRPNVTTDAAALCLKAGNASILRGGSESFNSSEALHKCLLEGVRLAGLPEASIQRVPTTNRDAVGFMLSATDMIDVIIPRGGKALIERIRNDARVPVFAHLEGICHIYIDSAADFKKAHDVVINSKTRRTGICGAAECLLIHRDVQKMGQKIINDLMSVGVEVRAGEGLEGSTRANAEDFGKEFLDMIIAAKLVDNIDDAIKHIDHYGSSHTDCIITEDNEAAKQFMNGLDSAILMRNVSTQFADGGEFGMGAEIGIATGKIHARGPIGAQELTSFKYFVEGDGVIRA